MKQHKITNFFIPITINNNYRIGKNIKLIKPKTLKLKTIKSIIDDGYLGDDEYICNDEKEKKNNYRVINLLDDLKYLKIKS